MKSKKLKKSLIVLSLFLLGFTAFYSLIFISQFAVDDNNSYRINAAYFGMSVNATAKSNLVYNGCSQVLVNKGTALTGYTVKYKLGDNGTWSTNLPSSVNAGTYKVYCSAFLNSYNVATYVDTITCTISKATPVIKQFPLAKTGLKYTGKQQELIYNNAVALTVDKKKNLTFNYRVNNGSWSSRIPTGLMAGGYTVEYKVIGDSNHSESSVYRMVVTISK